MRTRMEWSSSSLLWTATMPPRPPPAFICFSLSRMGKSVTPNDRERRVGGGGSSHFTHER